MDSLMKGISSCDPGTTLLFVLPFCPQTPTPKPSSLTGPGAGGHAGRPFPVQVAGRGG